MRKIKLTNGGEALVDNEDFERVNQFNWHTDTDGYVYRKLYLGKLNGKDKYRNLFIHRFILEEPKGKNIDHMNHNKLDNRKSNLRICMHSENMKNMVKPKNNTSGYKGVYYRNDGRIKKWTAQIRVNGKMHVKSFISIVDAAKYYNMLAIKYFGEFANLNKI